MLSDKIFSKNKKDYQKRKNKSNEAFEGCMPMKVLFTATVRIFRKDKQFRLYRRHH